MLKKKFWILIVIALFSSTIYCNDCNVDKKQVSAVLNQAHFHLKQLQIKQSNSSVQNFLKFFKLDSSLWKNITEREKKRLIDILKKESKFFSSVEDQALQYLLPYFQFESHPLFLNASPEKVKEIWPSLHAARNSYNSTLMFIFGSSLSSKQKIKILNEAMEKFFYDSKMESLFVDEHSGRTIKLFQLVEQLDVPLWMLAYRQFSPEGFGNEKKLEKYLIKFKSITQSASNYRMQQLQRGVQLSIEHRIAVTEMIESWPESLLKVAMKEADFATMAKAYFNYTPDLKEFLLEAAKYIESEEPTLLTAFLRKMNDVGYPQQIVELLQQRPPVLSAKMFARAITSPFFLNPPSVIALNHEYYLKYISILSGLHDHKILTDDILEAWAFDQKTAEMFMPHHKKNYIQMLVALGFNGRNKWAPLDLDNFLLYTKEGEFLVGQSAPTDVVKVTKVTDEHKEKVQLLMKKRKALELKFANAKSFPEILGELQKDKNAVALVSNGMHTGLYVNGYVYDVNTAGKVGKKLLTANDEWENDAVIFIQFAVDEKEVRLLQNNLDSDINKKLNFSIVPVPGTAQVNCALFSTNHLKRAGIYKFDNPICSMAPTEQVYFAVKKAVDDPRVKAVHLAPKVSAQSFMPFIEKAAKTGLIVGAGAGTAALGYFYLSSLK